MLPASSADTPTTINPSAGCQNLREVHSRNVPSAIESIFAGDLDTVGERVVRTLVENLDKSDRAPLVMLTRSAPTDARSAALLREFIDREITDRLAALLDIPDSAQRLATARYLARIEPIASSSVDELVATFGPLVQHCLTGQAAHRESGPESIR